MAETVYVRDTLYVPLRGGPTPEHRILHRGIRSGTPLEIMQQEPDSGWSLVRTQDGLEGWMQTQYLMAEPIASDQLETMQSRLLALEATHQQTLLRLQELRDENANLTTELQHSKAELETTSTALDEIRQLSADTIQIQARNESLQDERVELENQIDTLLMANDELQGDAAQEWFLRGGAVVIIAMLIGFWAARRIYQRNISTWN